MTAALMGAMWAAVLLTPSTNVRAAATVPALDHVFVITMENHSYNEIIGSSAAPYINSLLPSGGLATNYHGVAHPSLPNYLSLVGGSTFGITSDCSTCWVAAANIGDSIEAANKTWKAYLESMPSACVLGDSYPYVQKHDPFIYFNDIRTNTSRCQAHVVPYTQLATDLKSSATTPSYGFVTPNMCNDMHDCSVGTGDSWLKQQVPMILASPAFTTQHSLLALTWDEDDMSAGNQVPMILLGSGITPAFRSSAVFNHYSTLRTVEAALGLPTLTSNDAAATAMSTFFVSSPPGPCNSATLSPINPSAPAGALMALTAGSTGCSSPQYEFWVQYPDGSWNLKQPFSGSSTFTWNTTGLLPGAYLVHVWASETGIGHESIGSSSVALTGCISASLTPSSQTQAAGRAVSLIGAGSPGCPNPQIEYWVQYPDSVWHLARTWGAAPWSWDTSGLRPGNYTIHAWTNQSGASTATYEAIGSATVTLSGCTAASVVPPSGWATVGTPIPFTTSSVCSGTPVYEFWLQYPDATWHQQTNFTTTNAWTWNSTGRAKGSYVIHVWTNNQGADTGIYETIGSATYTLS